jgi:hypothetical protein
MEPQNYLDVYARYKYELLNITFIAVLSIIFKIIPHFPNFSPQILFFLYLSKILPKKLLCISIIMIAVLSDIFGSIIGGYSAFGSWTYFTYSSYVLLGLFGHWKYFSRKIIKFNFIGMSILYSIFFWLWTNFGVWILGTMYAHSMVGFVECYFLAIPFLTNSLEGTIIWGFVFIVFDRLLKIFDYSLWNKLKLN